MKKVIGFLVIILFLGCKKNEDIRPGGKGDGETIIDIEYKKDAVVIDGSKGDVVLDVDIDEQIYTLNKEAFKNRPKVGEVVYVTGEMLRKVKSIQSQGNTYIVETDDAAVTDVVQNGKIQFEVQPEWTDASSMRLNNNEMLNKGQKISLEPLEFNLNVGGISHQVLIEPIQKGGKINSCKFTVLLTKGGFTSFSVTGEATLPSQKVDFTIENGKLKKFNSDSDGLVANFKAEMATAGGNSGEHSLKLPKLALSFPVSTMLGIPIPMTIDVGMQFVSQMTIVDPRSSAIGKTSVKFSAAGGFKYEGTELLASGRLDSGDITDGTFDSAAGIGNLIDLQYGLAFPRISLNIISQEVAFIHVGFTTGSSLTWGPLCKRGYSKVEVSGGYSLKALGQTIVSGTKDFAKIEKRAGGDCD